MGQHVKAGELETWTEQVGQGPDVLLIGGLGDTVESWQCQLDGLADRYRMTAFDNRGAGRTAMPQGQPTVEAMADDAAAVLPSLGVSSAHVAGSPAAASLPWSSRCATPKPSAAWCCKAPGQRWTTSCRR
ncbi:alpha/beta fold hydrolase [Arthrobacter sulfonylureivorans]|uniref:Alpha/beta hydrolase n=1 Tax=Arthrobacter sulfonylureivorans TaxID=2486855 RepID=A0ABY3W2K2_9MICC|nr:alpha/beta hydrolase [Arthrobacter sulfonylureivorans]UNK44274.1 alpha/beta hydrolase [Arthrobacter sulfonylureivorans]